MNNSPGGKSDAAEVADDRALVMTRVFDAPRELVFRLWSDPEQVKRRWHPRDFTTPVFEMDFRVGGAYRYCIRSKGQDGWAHGTYREIVAPERLGFTFQWDSGDAAHDTPTLITLAFAAQGDNTLLTFRAAPAESRRARSLSRQPALGRGASTCRARSGEATADGLGLLARRARPSRRALHGRRPADGHGAAHPQAHTLIADVPVLATYLQRREARPAFGKALAAQIAAFARNAPVLT